MENPNKQDFDRILKRLLIKEKLAILGGVLCSTQIDFLEDSDTIKSLATDGNKIYINNSFWEKLSDQDKVYGLANMLWKVAYFHPTRGYGKDQQHWSNASDIIVNNLLLNSDIKPDKLKIIYNNSLKDHSTEEIYQKLTLGIVKPPPPENNDFNNNLLPSPDGTNQQEFEREVLTKLSGLNNGIGDIPGEIQEILDQFFKPKIKFGVILDKFLTALGEEERSYKRPHRRSTDEIILPSFIEQENKLQSIIAYIDCSGSISDKDIKIFNSELKGIKEKFNPAKITIVSFDTKIMSINEIKDDDNFDFIELVGRGGTCLKCVGEHILDNKPQVAMIFTDLEVSYIPPKPKDTDIIWLVNTKNPYSKPTYGKHIYVDVGAYKDE